MRIAALILFALVVATSAFAQDSDKDARLMLARKMHELQPAARQVEDAISSAAELMPDSQRQMFKEQMAAAMDVKKLETLSVETMAGIFSQVELQSMVDYYSKPEARSAADKMPLYQKTMQPEIVRMLDEALMKLRTGSGAQK